MSLNEEIQKLEELSRRLERVAENFREIYIKAQAFDTLAYTNRLSFQTPNGIEISFSHAGAIEFSRGNVNLIVKEFK
jgi:hypothetical protein